jgi:hypothetical protein
MRESRGGRFCATAKWELYRRRGAARRKPDDLGADIGRIRRVKEACCSGIAETRSVRPSHDRLKCHNGRAKPCRIQMMVIYPCGAISSEILHDPLRPKCQTTRAEVLRLLTTADVFLRRLGTTGDKLNGLFAVAA